MKVDVRDVFERLWLYPAAKPNSKFKPGEFYLSKTTENERQAFKNLTSSEISNVRWPLYDGIELG